MSLFKSKEWWRTQCGDTSEIFDAQSLLITQQLLGPEAPGTAIVVTSHAGYLRIYMPTNKWENDLNAPGAYKSTDLAVEAKLADCILDVKDGKFVSGSKDTRLAILMPTKLIIYTVIFTKGSTEHGDCCSMKIAYEHQLKRFPVSLTVGPFGGARGRDFLCVQCLDGTLLFYEQEVYVFSCFFKSRLLPEPLIYVSRNDLFVTLGSDWILQCYRYQNLAESNRKEKMEKEDTKTDIVPDWSYNIGEPILDINVVILSSFETGIIVLGQRTLYCLGDSCTTIKFSKRLHYSPLCFHAYVIEPDGKLMVIVVADTNTLMIYEGTTLKWSAQLPFAPVAVARTNLQNLEGGIVILSEMGCLEVCYLGSEPSLFVAPPIHRRGFDYAAAEKELLNLRRLLKKSPLSDIEVKNAVTESELSISTFVSPELLPAPNSFKQESEDKESNQCSMCKISLELLSYTIIQNVEVILESSKPLVISKDLFFLSNLCEKYSMDTMVYLEGDALPISTEVTITATYEKEGGELRVVQKSVEVPLKMLLRTSAAETSASFAVTIKSAEPVLSFSQVFPEFVGEYSSKQITNSLGLKHAQTGHVVTLTSGLMLNRYRVQASDGAALLLVVQQLISRLRDKAPTVFEKLSCNLTQPHLQLVMTNLDDHFAARLKIRANLKEIGLLTTQLRNIEKRMLRCTRERNSRSLVATGLPTLLESTYSEIFELLDDLQAARAERVATFHNLQCSLRLMFILLQLNVNDDYFAMLLESVIEFKPELRDEDDWEEAMDITLTTLNRKLSGKTEFEKNSIEDSVNQLKPCSTRIKFESTRDLGKLKKHLSQLVVKLTNNSMISIQESPVEELIAENSEP